MLTNSLANIFRVPELRKRLLFSLGMLRVAGWAHDAWSTSGMLLTEAVTGVVALVVFALLARRIPGE